MFYILIRLAARNRLTIIIGCVYLLFLIANRIYFFITYADPGSYYYKKAAIQYVMHENLPFTKANIVSDFPLGEGLGFQPIRNYYELKQGEYNPNKYFFISYANNPRQNSSEKIFGSYAVSENTDQKSENRNPI